MAELMWQVLRRQLLHDAYPWVRLTSEHVRLPNGAEIPDFYCVEIAPYVMIFAITGTQEVLMVEHYKHGPELLSLELPAGYIETGEDPQETAQRELREETGYASTQWQGLGRYFIDGNRGCGWMHAFLAQNSVQVGEAEPESTELMQIHLKSLDETYELWRNGSIMNIAAATLIGRSLLELGYLNT